MAGHWSAAARRNLYADGNTDDGNFLANGTRGLNNHIWWTKRKLGLIRRPLPRQWNRHCGLGGSDIHDNTTSKVTRAWSESNKLYKSIPPTPDGTIIC